MPRLDFLDRFRPVGTPGPAGPVGIPTNEATGPAAELAPVFAALIATFATNEQLVADARTAGAARIEAARRQAAGLVAAAQQDAPAARADAAARVVEQADRNAVAELAAAQDEAGRITAAAAARRDRLVARAVAHLLGGAA
ncbi:hypothetical protein [Gryllotalpicola sp.]|uniref:hypothetical protein n=1 Tax=Gryllotalpicola sp. TaxID=1932787 RepID=UPI002637F432|nr:hypothetical protein [Gryllotalpicola sp.]